MDAKVTLSFDAHVIEKAKRFAEGNGISLSRLTEILLKKAIAGNYNSIEEMPIADWVSMVAEGNSEYVTKPRKRKSIKQEYFNRKK
jgi:antitoxin component of RelBE/YafQ-DinJ toxin-antitoxin module